MNCFVTEGGWVWGGKITFGLGMHLDPVHPILTKIGMDMVFDPKKQAYGRILDFFKIQDGGLRSKVQHQPNLTPQITFRLRIWILFIRFGQNLAWTY